MSLSFPTAPTIGQMFGGFVWDGVKWTSPFGPAGLAQVALEVQLNAAMTGLASGTWNTLRYDTKVTDLQNAYVPSTGLFTPRQAGLYLVSATVPQTQGTAQDWQSCAIVKNGARTTGQSQATIGNMGSAGVNTSTSVTALIFCNGTTDNISVQFNARAATLPPSATAGYAVNMVATLLQVGPQGPAGSTGSGNKVLLGTTVVVAAVASVDFFSGFDGSYDELELVGLDVQLSAEAGVGMRFSLDGSTFVLTAGAYYYTNNYTGTSSSAAGGTTAALMQMGPSWSATAATPSNFRARFRVNTTTPTPSMFYEALSQNATQGVLHVIGMGRFVSVQTGPPLGIRFLPVSGNITRGIFKLYGIVK